MTIIDIILIGIGLSMDAFAVSICKGLMMRRLVYKNVLIVAFYFGLFQMIMPLFGYYGGLYLSSIITKINYLVSFILLSIIGINMIREGIVDNDINSSSRISYKEMIPLAFATSIDALTVGVTCAFLDVNIICSSMIIGGVTFILSFIGVIVGYFFGIKFHKISLIFGGITLISIGFKIILEQLL